MKRKCKKKTQKIIEKKGADNIKITLYKLNLRK